MIHVQLSTRTNLQPPRDDVIKITHLVVEEINIETSCCNHRIIYLYKNLQLLRKDNWTPTQLYYRHKDLL